MASRLQAGGQVPGSEPASEGQDEDDALDKILDNYQFLFEPEMRLKFKKRLEQMHITAAWCKPWERNARWRFTVKPGVSAPAWCRYVSKVQVTPAFGVARAFSSKIRLFSVLRLQLVASFNWATLRPTLDYRLTTKWSDRLRRKEQVRVFDNLLLRCRWNLELLPPNVQG